MVIIAGSSSGALYGPPQGPTDMVLARLAVSTGQLSGGVRTNVDAGREGEATTRMIPVAIAAQAPAGVVVVGITGV